MPSIDAIQGIGPRDARRLRKLGIRTTEGLLKRGSTRAERKKLAAEAGVEPTHILGWVNRADLMRIKGIGSEYSDLLEAAGVDTVRELRRRNPLALSGKMVELNDGHRLVRRLPTEGMVARWVEQAQALDPMVSY